MIVSRLTVWVVLLSVAIVLASPSDARARHRTRNTTTTTTTTTPTTTTTAPSTTTTATPTTTTTATPTATTTTTFTCNYTGPNLTTTAQSRMTRGVNLSRWWETVREISISDQEIANLKKAGFTFVRLPLSPYWVTKSDATARDQALTTLRCDILKLLNQGTVVLLDLHAPDNMQAQWTPLDPYAAATGIAAQWRILKPYIGDLPPSLLALGLYNEPSPNFKDWWTTQGYLVTMVRQDFPRFMLGVEANYGGFWNLGDHPPYADTNLAYEFHYYEPLFLTHHGAEWLSETKTSEYTDVITYPVAAQPASTVYATAAATSPTGFVDPRMVDYLSHGWSIANADANIAMVATWKNKYHVFVFLGEFGVYKPHVPAASRANWIHDVRVTAEKYGIPWLLWDYNSGFGLLNNDMTMNAGLVTALGVTAP